MTQATKTPETMLTQMTWLPCNHCHGKKALHTSWHLNECECSPCPSCQDSEGTATGLLMPGLSEECPGSGIWSHIILEKLRSINPDVYPECICQGRDRIPRRHDVLEAIETELEDFGDWTYKYCPDWNFRNPHWYELHHYEDVDKAKMPYTQFGSPDRKEAAIAALYAALVAKGLVEC